MTVYYNEKRGRWCYDFERGGKRYASYAEDDAGNPATGRRQAEAIETRLKAKIDAENKRGKAAVVREYSLAEALAYYAENVAKGLDSWSDIKVHIKELLEQLGAATPVETMTGDDIQTYIAWAKKQKTRVYVGGPRRKSEGGGFKEGKKLRARSTINKFLITLKAALRFALKNEKVKIIPNVPLVYEGKEAPNPVKADDLASIMRLAPKHLRNAIALGALTGMRQTECLSLTWRQVDFGIDVILLRAEGTKSEVGRQVLLNATARQLLLDMAADRPTPHRLDQPVITWRGAPIKSLKRSWHTALKRANLLTEAGKNTYRLHDLRAAYCSLLAKRGVNPVDIQRLVGHADIKTTMRYTEAHQPHLRAAVGKLEAEIILPTFESNSPKQEPQTAEKKRSKPAPRAKRGNSATSKG